MKIKKIQKVSKNKYKIYFDDAFLLTYDNVIIENNLLYKKEIDKFLYEKILKDTYYFDIYTKIIKFSSKKRRSEKEIQEYIDKYNLDDISKKKVITILKNLKLMDDLEYVKAYINDNIYLSKKGINKIRIELLNQNINAELIENELSKIDSELINQKVEKIILKKIKSNHKYSNQFLKQKLLNEMIMLGYPKELVNNIIDRHLKTDEDDIIKKEFNKVYNKLKVKYNGDDLKNMLKQKLLLKGFCIEDINNLIEINNF